VRRREARVAVLAFQPHRVLPEAETRPAPVRCTVRSPAGRAAAFRIPPPTVYEATQPVSATPHAHRFTGKRCRPCRVCPDQRCTRTRTSDASRCWRSGDPPRISLLLVQQTSPAVLVRGVCSQPGTQAAREKVKRVHAKAGKAGSAEGGGARSVSECRECQPPLAGAAKFDMYASAGAKEPCKVRAASAAAAPRYFSSTWCPSARRPGAPSARTRAAANSAVRATEGKERQQAGHEGKEQQVIGYRALGEW